LYSWPLVKRLLGDHKGDTIYSSSYSQENQVQSFTKIYKAFTSLCIFSENYALF
jgi:hypothetical protein